MSWILARKKLLFSRKPANVAYAGNATASVGGNPHTFSSVAIGTAAVDRYVIVAVAIRKQNQAGQAGATAVTVAGTACTQIGSSVQSDSNHLSLWRTNSPITSGTTANIAVTHVNTYNNLGVAAWAVTGLQSVTPTDTDSTTTDAASVTSTVSAGGIIVAAAYSVGLSAGTHTWTGVTEDFDSLSVGASGSVSGGSLNSPGGGNISVSADGTQTGSAFMMIAASFR